MPSFLIVWLYWPSYGLLDISFQTNFSLKWLFQNIYTKILIKTNLSFSPVIYVRADLDHLQEAISKPLIFSSESLKGEIVHMTDASQEVIYQSQLIITNSISRNKSEFEALPMLCTGLWVRAFPQLRLDFSRENLLTVNLETCIICIKILFAIENNDRFQSRQSVNKNAGKYWVFTFWRVCKQENLKLN